MGQKSCTCSLVVFAFMNVVTLLVSLVMLAAVAYLPLQPSTACDRLMQVPILVSGTFLFVVSLMGLVGSCCRISSMLWLYLTVLFLLILALTCLTVIVFLVTNKSAAAAVSGKGYGQYRLGDYSRVLERVVTEEDTWESIQSCLKAGMVCGGSAPAPAIPLDPSEFYKAKLSFIQSGCCKPPPGCGISSATTSRNKTSSLQANPERALLAGEGDCKAWSSDPLGLCFACESCKAGFLDNIQQDWKVLAIFNVALLLALFFVYCVGCCAARSNRGNRYQGYIGGNRP